MGLIGKILGLGAESKGAATKAAPYFETFTEYSPVFSSYRGGIYELELTRAAIDRFATGCSKLKPEIVGSASPRVARAFETSPNAYMTWPRFLYRLATILECDATAFVVPALAPDGETVTGVWPMADPQAEVVEYAGEPWVRFHFATGGTAAIELRNVCVVSKFQYHSDLFGERNVLGPTMGLISAQNKAQEAAIKSGAAIRFIGAVNGQVREEELDKKKRRFSDDNLGEENRSGMLVYDSTFQKVEQVKPYNYAIPAEEMSRICNSVYNYFGTNEHILQNDYSEDQWNAYYEGKIEPFAIQLGDGLSHMLYTQRERARNRVSFSSNRLEYATSASKRNMIRDMLDRGLMSINEGREILQMPPVEGGDRRVIRGEYIDATMLDEHREDTDPSEHDLTKKDSDKHGVKDADGLDV